jgi:hypothetical protein
MQAHLDPEILGTPGRPDSVSSKSERPSLPDIHDRPRRRMHPMLAAGLAFGFAAVVFYGGEAFLPREYRPSTFIGGYQTEITEAAKAGELAAQIRYDAQLRGIELQYQDGLSRIQTAANQWQEQCRAGLANVNNLYQAIYNRANMYVQATAQLQQAYQSARQAIVSGTLGGDVALMNMLSVTSQIVAMFDPAAARQMMQAANGMRRDILGVFDREARNGITISVRGWDSGLPRPDALPPMIRCDVPTYATGVSSNPITVPPNASPRR